MDVVRPWHCRRSSFTDEAMAFRIIRWLSPKDTSMLCYCTVVHYELLIHHQSHFNSSIPQREASSPQGTHLRRRSRAFTVDMRVALGLFVHVYVDRFTVYNQVHHEYIRFRV